ncbi:TfoX/Sxy family DNA transformation protein [Saccharospirillum sp. MSK14-1]|uniref:TfoX/Sxy family DNA transformation protein n=1 Tax=Saccharospirillum sp. MSK14-1 TaxID=1897632 RepID=UPI001E478108|nr:TfoX/Sxy family DNA transformation protein [Saccharospirillum sp. MSK14-1]
MLLSIGIRSREDLERIGPVRAYALLQQEQPATTSLNLLYAMVGALENRHWASITHEEKARLLMELESYKELNSVLKDSDPDAQL